MKHEEKPAPKPSRNIATAQRRIVAQRLKAIVIRDKAIAEIEALDAALEPLERWGGRNSE